jgi:hypothetical protein
LSPMLEHLPFFLSFFLSFFSFPDMGILINPWCNH